MNAITVTRMIDLQAALDNIDVGGMITIVPGIYDMVSSLANRAGTVFGITPFAFRAKKACTVSAYGAVFRLNTANLAYGGLWAYQLTGFQFKGGRFIGSDPVTEGGQLSRPAILLHDCNNSRVEDVSAVNFSQGVNLYECEDCQLYNVMTDDTFKSGIMVYKSGNSELRNCDITNAGDGHLSLYITRSSYVENCTVRETRGHTGEQGITLEVDQGSMIENCTVDGFYHGIDIKNNSRGSMVFDNTLLNNLYQVSVRLGDPNNSQAPCDDIQIMRNYMTDQWAGTSSPVFVQGATNVKIEYNTADAAIPAIPISNGVARNNYRL